MNNVCVRKQPEGRISQGAIFRDVASIEYVVEREGIVEVSKINYPFVVILTQDCDLEQDARYKLPESKKPSSDDKRLFYVLVAPLYVAEHVVMGTHLAEIGLTMQRFDSKTKIEILKNNETPRYHYLDFPEDVSLVPQIVDFKHHFSVNAAVLEQEMRSKFVCQISELFRERLSQRFAAYLSRIGLPR